METNEYQPLDLIQGCRVRKEKRESSYLSPFLIGVFYTGNISSRALSDYRYTYKKKKNQGKKTCLNQGKKTFFWQTSPMFRKQKYLSSQEMIQVLYPSHSTDSYLHNLPPTWFFIAVPFNWSLSNDSLPETEMFLCLKKNAFLFPILN